MRILIAEDELLERKAMKKFIEENFNQMTVVGEAANGRKAIELAETTYPDIIFMDIKMPGINGLEAIEKINAANPTIKFILVSAYDSFDYAKEAMRFGIKDYILKPGKKEEIVKSLLRLKKEIEAARTEKEQSRALMEERFLTKVMHPPVPDEVLTLKEDLFPAMKSGCFFVLKTEQVDVTEAIKKVIEQPYIVQRNEDIIVICIMAPDKMEKAALLILARKLHVVLDEKATIGIGFPTANLESLPKSYQEAYAACLQFTAENKRPYGFRQEKELLDREVITELGSFVEKGQAEGAIQYFKKNQLTDGEKEDLYLTVKSVLTAKELTISGSTFTSLKTNEDWHAYLQLCCMKVNEFHQSKQYIAQAKTYIHDHFNEAITLEKVATKVNLSPNYFSNLFKQEFGDTFIDYLTKVRLENAKTYMERNYLSLKEISFMVGYKDPNYFSRVFKKYYHESPKRFQQGIFRK